MESNICYGVDMSKEQWRTKPEWEGYYEFSNWGGARSVDRVVTYKNGSKHLHRGRALKVDERGYISININGKTQFFLLYNVIAELFIEDYIEGIPISPRDGDRSNCRLDNLQVGCSLHGNGKKLMLHETAYMIDNIPVIEGGFTEGQRVLFDIALAEKVGKQLSEFRRCNITLNLDNWEKEIDYINIKEYANFNDYIPLLLELGYTSNGILTSNAIYILSERGVAKVMSSLHNTNPAKWQFLNNFVNEYFNMREQIKNQTPQIDIRTQAIIDIVNASASGDAVQLGIAIGNFEKNITAPLIETIEEQKPKVAKYQEYVDSDGYIAPRQAAQILKLPHATAQAFNKLLKEHRVQYKNGKNWVLYEDFSWMLKEGYCKQVPYIDSTGTTHYNLRWTSKGLDYIRDNILNKP